MNISPTLRNVIDDRNNGRSIYPQTDPGHSPSDELALQQAIESPEIESHVIEPPEIHEGLSQSMSGDIGADPDQPDSLDFNVPTFLANTGGGGIGGNDFFDRAGSGSRGDFFTNRGGAQMDPNTGRGIPGTGRGNLFDNAAPRRNFFEGGGQNANWRAHWTGAGGPNQQQRLANAPTIEPMGQDQLLGQGDFEDAGPISRGEAIRQRQRAKAQQAIREGRPIPAFGHIPQGLFNRPALVQGPNGALRHNVHRRFSHGRGPHPWKRGPRRMRPGG